MRAPLVLLGIVLSTLVGSAASSARCLSYEPARVSLSGELTSRSVPGPPNYSSIARGDFAETILILVLDSPICVSAGTSGGQNSRGHFNVTQVQLVVSGASQRGLLHRHVRASGTLFAAHTRHHRTPVVLMVESLGKTPKGSGGA